MEQIKLENRLALRVTEFADAIGASRSKAYQMVAAGEVPSVRIGGCIRIPLVAAKQWLASLQAGPLAPTTGAQIGDE